MKIFSGALPNTTCNWITLRGKIGELREKINLKSLNGWRHLKFHRLKRRKVLWNNCFHPLEIVSYDVNESPCFSDLSYENYTLVRGKIKCKRKRKWFLNPGTTSPVASFRAHYSQWATLFSLKEGLHEAPYNAIFLQEIHKLLWNRCQLLKLKFICSHRETGFLPWIHLAPEKDLELVWLRKPL